MSLRYRQQPISPLVNIAGNPAACRAMRWGVGEEELSATVAPEHFETQQAFVASFTPELAARLSARLSSLILAMLEKNTCRHSVRPIHCHRYHGDLGICPLADPARKRGLAA
jgi:hypothetical protein